jgi:hypothetical protein
MPVSEPFQFDPHVLNTLKQRTPKNPDNPMKTDPQPIRQFLSEARNCAMQMMENGNYIQKELPSLTMPDELREKLDAICTSLIGTKHDLIHEIFEIDELVTTTPESPSIARSIERVRLWILGEVDSFNGGVAQVQEAVQAGTTDPLLQILLMESGFNILRMIPSAPASGETTEAEPDEAEEDNEGDYDGEGDEENEEDDHDPNCYAFYSEDSYPVGTLIKAIRGLMERPKLPKETTGNLKVLLFAMQRLPLVTPGVQMSLGLRLDQGGESAWIEIRMGDGEFSLGSGTWIDGDADTETIFEVTPDYREGDAFVASQFAESFKECARDVCREVVIEDWSDETFTGWDLKPDPKRWGSLHCSFL